MALVKLNIFQFNFSFAQFWQSTVVRGTLGTLYLIHREKLNQHFSMHAINRKVSPCNSGFEWLLKSFDCKQIPVGLVHAWTMDKVIKDRVPSIPLMNICIDFCFTQTYSPNIIHFCPLWLYIHRWGSFKCYCLPSASDWLWRGAGPISGGNQY